MGHAAVRIAETDFLIPPEFADCPPVARTAGQLGGVRIELVERSGETRLGDCYQQMPLRLLPPFYFASEAVALVYLINPTVGLMDGDAHRIELIARPGTRAVVTGQSASRIHPAPVSYATQQWHVAVEDNAALVILPGPAIPYRGSRYFQRVDVELAESARLVWGDIWYPGRHQRTDDPELFVFERLIQHLEVRRAGRLVYRERFDWRGPWSDAERSWHFGEDRAAASLFVSGRLGPTTAPADKRLARAVFPLTSGDTCVRMTGAPPEVTRAACQLAFTQAGSWSGSRPWLLADHNLAPNHWFSVPLT